jgi:hypothetical protein
MGVDFDQPDPRDLTSDVRETPSREDLSATPVPTATDDARVQRIAERAYFLSMARDNRHGDALSDWLEAERQIDEEIE